MISNKKNWVNFSLEIIYLSLHFMCIFMHYSIDSTMTERISSNTMRFCWFCKKIHHKINGDMRTGKTALLKIIKIHSGVCMWAVLRYYMEKYTIFSLNAVNSVKNSVFFFLSNHVHCPSFIWKQHKIV